MIHHHRRITVMRQQLAIAVRRGDRAAELVLRSRLEPPCSTPDCQRARMASSGWCHDCLNARWANAA